ncbi:MAG: PAS domain S-box protein, partial [Leptolyngbya sp.]|nr:PAS domain S-box protein [Leptolyngbya sp.]
MASEAGSTVPWPLSQAIARFPLMAEASLPLTAAIAQLQNPTAPPPEAALTPLQQQARATCLVVVAQQQVVGLWTASDRLRVSPQMEAQQCLGESITPAPAPLREQDLNTLAPADAWAVVDVFQQQGCSHLPVINQQGHAVGVLTPALVLAWLRMQAPAPSAVPSEPDPTAAIAAALAQQQTFLRTVVDTIPHCIFIQDRDGKVLLVNQASAAVANTTVAAMEGHYDHELGLNPTLLARFHQENQQVIDRQQPLFIPEEHSFPLNNQDRWLQWHKYPITFPIGNVPAVLGIGIDITHHRDISTTLQSLLAGTTATGADFFPALVKHIAAALGVRYVALAAATPAGFKMLALEAEAPLEVPEVVPYEALPCCVQAMTTGEYLHTTHAQQDYPGCALFTALAVDSYLGVGLRNSAGKPIGNLCVLHDRPLANVAWSQQILRIFAARAGAELERYQTAQALERLNAQLEVRIAERTASLQASEERLRLALEGTQAGLWDWDLVAQRVFYSDRWLAIRGYERHQVSDRLDIWHDGIHPEDVGAVMAALETHLAGRSPYFEMEYRVRHRDGHYVWILDRGQAARDDTGAAIRMGGFETDINDRKLAEADRDRLLGFLDASLNEVYAFDAHSLKFIYANRGAIQNLGYSLQQLQTMTPLDLKPTFNEANCRALLHPVLTGEVPLLRFESHHRRADGSQYPIEVYVQAHTYWGHQYYLAVILDITERQQAEAALRKSEQRYRALMDGASDAILLANPDGHIIEANQRATELLGYRREELTRMRIADLHPPEALPAIMAGVNQIFQNNHAPPLETWVLHRDGSRIPVEITGCRMELEGQFFSQGIIRDIRDRKRLEAERQAAALENQRLGERLQFLLSASPAIIYTCEATGNYPCTFISDNVETILGYRPAEYLAEPDFWLQRIHPDDTPRVLADLVGLAERGVHRHDYRFRHRDSHYLWVHDELRLVRDDHGQPLELVGYFADISDRKAAEQRLQQQAQQERILGTIARRLQASLDLREILTVAVEELHRCLQCNQVLVYQLLSDQRRVVIAEAQTPTTCAPLLDHVLPTTVLPSDHSPVVIIQDAIAEAATLSPALREFLAD